LRTAARQIAIVKHLHNTHQVSRKKEAQVVARKGFTKKWFGADFDFDRPLIAA